MMAKNQPGGATFLLPTDGRSGPTFATLAGAKATPEGVLDVVVSDLWTVLKSRWHQPRQQKVERVSRWSPEVCF